MQEMAAIRELRACSTLKQAKIVMSQLCGDNSLSQMLAIMIVATNIDKNGLVLNFYISSYVILEFIEYAALNNALLPLLVWNEIIGWCFHYSNIQKFGTRKIVLSLLDFLLHTRMVNLVFSGTLTVIDLLMLISLEEKDLNLSLTSVKILLQFVLDESHYHLICPVIICISRFVTTSNKMSFEKCLMLIKSIAQSNLFNRQFKTGTSYSDVINILVSEIEINPSLSSSNDTRLVNIESKNYEKQFIIIFNKYILSKLLSLWNDEHQVSANPRVAVVMEMILHSNHLVVDPVLILNKKDVRLVSPNDAIFDFNYILNQSSSIVTSYIDQILKSSLVWLLPIFKTPLYIRMQKIIETLDVNIIQEYSMQIAYNETKCNNITANKLINLIALSLCTSALVGNNKLSLTLSKQFADLFSKFLQSICESILSDATIYLSLIIVSWFKIVENGIKLNPIDIDIIIRYVPLLMKNLLIMPCIVSLSFSCKYTMLLSKILHQIPIFLDNCYCNNGDIELARFIHIFKQVIRANSKMIIKSYMVKNAVSNEILYSTMTNYTTQQDTKNEINQNIVVQLEELVAANSIYHKYWKFFEALVKSNDFTVNIRVAAYLCVVEYMKNSTSFRDSMTTWLQHTLVSNIEKDEIVYLHLQVLQSWSILFEMHKSDITIISLYNSIMSSSKTCKILAVYLMKLLYSYIIDENIRSNKTSDYVLAISLPILKKCKHSEVEVMAKLLLSRILNYDSSVFTKIILHICTNNPLVYAHVDEDGISSLLSYLFEVVNDIELSRVEILLTQEAIQNKNLSAAKILHLFKLTETSKKSIDSFLNYGIVVTSESDNTLQQILIKRVSKKRRK